MDRSDQGVNELEREALLYSFAQESGESSYSDDMDNSHDNGSRTQTRRTQTRRTKRRRSSKKNNAYYHSNAEGQEEAKIFVYLNTFKVARLTLAAVICALAVLLPAQGSLNTVLFGISFAVAGIDLIVFAVYDTIKGKVLSEYLLMSFVTICALVIGEYAEGVIVAILFQFGKLLQDYVESRSVKAVSHLSELQPDTVMVSKGGDVSKASAKDIEVGAAIAVSAGETIPLDGVVRAGSSDIDMSPLSKNATPRHVSVGDRVSAGCINLGSELTLEVSKTNSYSAVSKIAGFVTSENKSEIEKFIDRFARYYTITVLAAALIIAVLPSILTGPMDEYIHRALVLIIVACPGAVVIPASLSYFIGIGKASKHAVFIRGGKAVDAVASIHTAVFDKTGTLTEGEYSVRELRPTNSISAGDLLMIAAYAEMGSNHPIAHSIIRAYGENLEHSLVQSHTDIAGGGAYVKMRGNDIYVGNAKLMRAVGISIEEDDENKVYVAINGIYAGAIVIYDKLKLGAAEAIGKLKELGVMKTALFTGDGEREGKRTARLLGIDEVCCELLPDEKVVELERLKSYIPKGGALMFTGKGVKDAPVIAMADVGVVMGALNSDAMIEPANVAVLGDDLDRLPIAVRISRRTRRAAEEGIVLAFAVKIVLLILGALGIFKMWPTVLIEIGACLLVTLNSMRLMLFDPTN